MDIFKMKKEQNLSYREFAIKNLASTTVLVSVYSLYVHKQLTQTSYVSLL